MGPRVSMLFTHEDPWRASAFISILTQLLLTILVLVHTILVCVTFQLVKWYVWWIPSCRSHSGFDSCVAKKPLSLGSDDNKNKPLISTDRFLKHSRGEDFRLTSRPLVCPKCYGVWTFKQGLSFNSDRAPTSQWGETPTSSDAGNLSGARSSYSEEGVRNKYGCDESMTPRAVDELLEMSNPSEKNLKKTSSAKMGDDADENVWVETRVLTEESMKSANMPINGNEWSQTPVIEDVLFAGGLVEEARHREMEDEVLDEDTAVVVKRRVHIAGCERENAINTFKVEELSAILGKDVDGKENDSESVITCLRHAVQKERKKLCALHAELEVERISSETAANEAMSMISRLQEEKAALCMQAAQYQRLVEEKNNHDEQAMQLLKEILYRKERENYLLEREVKVMKKRIFKDVRKFGKKRQDVERRPFFEGGEETLLLKNVEELSDQGEGQGMRVGVQELETKSKIMVLDSVGQRASCPSRITEEQPLKRLKALNDGEDGTSQGTFLASDTGHFTLLKGNATEQRDGSSFEDFNKESGAPSTSSDSELAINFGCQNEVGENMPKAYSGRGMSPEASLPLYLVQSASVMLSGLEACQLDAISKHKQEHFPRNGEEARSLPLLHQAGKVSEPCKYGEWSHKAVDVTYSRKGTTGSSTPSSSDDVAGSSSVMSCAVNGQETQDQARTNKLLQPVSIDLNENAKKDRQYSKNSTMPWSCPFSLNKGSGMNKFEENDSSLMSHVH